MENFKFCIFILFYIYFLKIEIRKKKIEYIIRGQKGQGGQGKIIYVIKNTIIYINNLLYLAPAPFAPRKIRTAFPEMYFALPFVYV